MLAMFQSTPAGALVKFDFEQKFFTEPGQSVLDHYLLEVDGVYHLFYLRGNPALSIGHAVTTDLVHWTLEPQVLYPGSWDAKLWAPHLIQNPSGPGWIMYYTGVSSTGSQQTGVAFSPDLYNWSKYPFPVYHPDPAWAEWSSTYFTHGRDPHVVENNGQHYLFNTATTWTNKGAVACATSSDRVNWTDIGPAYVHYTWHVMESIFVTKRNDKFHMFFTEETVNGTSHMSSDSLLSGWDVIANRRIIDMGHAPQVSKMSGGAEIFSRHQIYNDLHGLQMYTLRFDTLQWFGDIPSPYKPWGLAADWTQVEGNAFTFQPIFGNNPYVRGEAVAPTYVGNCWIGTKERYTGPIGFGIPGASQGDTPVGVIRSRTFTIEGYSMNLLVGGSNNPDSCYVALVANGTGAILCKSTGLGVEEMDRRYWDLYPHAGKDAYLEIVDRSPNGHINVDDIIERPDRLTLAQGDGKSKRKPATATERTTPDGAAVVLRQNTPNPFNPTTMIAFELPAPARVVLDVFDVGGALVDRLAEGPWAAGPHRVTWDGTDASGEPVSSGVYFYRLTVDGRVAATRKMALLK
jgi:hypothetical protein